MLRTGKEHTASLRDGRIVYIGGERVDDVTQHPAFCNAAQTVATIYDMKADSANRDVMSYEEDGGRHSMYFLRAKTRDDLQRRMICHRRISDLTYGMFGRSPDHVASFITGMVMKPDELKSPCAHADNLLAYYRYVRDNDLYIVYAVLPPQAARDPEFYQRQNIPVPTLRVIREDDSGVVISGMKMLATGRRRVRSSCMACEPVSLENVDHALVDGIMRGILRRCEREMCNERARGAAVGGNHRILADGFVPIAYSEGHLRIAFAARRPEAPLVGFALSNDMLVSRHDFRIGQPLPFPERDFGKPRFDRVTSGLEPERCAHDLHGLARTHERA